MNQNRITLIICFIFCFAIHANSQSEQNALELINQKRFVEARAIYSELAVKYPERVSYKVWVARLSSWLGELAPAVKIYDEVIAENPNVTEAFVGKAFTELWRRHDGAAKKTLERIKQEDQESAGVLVAKINWFRFRSQFAEARKLNDFALTRYPQNVEFLELKKSLERLSPFKTQFGCSQNFDPITAETLSCGGSITFSRNKEKLSGSASTGRRFGKRFSEIGFTWVHDFDSKTKSIITASFDPNSKGSFDISASLNHVLSSRIILGIDSRFWRLNNKNIRINSPRFVYKFDAKNVLSSTIYFSNQKVLVLRYNRSFGERFNTSFLYIEPLTGTTKTTVIGEAKYKILKNFELSASYGLKQNNAGGYTNLLGWGFSVTK